MDFDGKKRQFMACEADGNAVGVEDCLATANKNKS